MGPISSTASRRRSAVVPGSGSKTRTGKSAKTPQPAPTPIPVPGQAQLLAASDQNQARQRDDLIILHMPMAQRIARSFAGRGEDLDDLTQAAMLELVKAAGRFDPSHGVSFAHYAFPCITGAVKRHFRDNGWSMHITRRMQELHLQTSRATPLLTQLLGRAPTVADLAIHLNLSETDARNGVNSRLAYQTRSLDQPANADGECELISLLGDLDGRLESVPDRHALSQYLGALSARDRSILYLRFIQDLTQREIAEQLGISQMHVSRLLGRSLGQLRTLLMS